MSTTEQAKAKEVLPSALLEAIQREVYIYERGNWPELQNISVDLLPMTRLGQDKVTAVITHVTCWFKELKHVHNWVSGDNEVVSGVDICLGCMRARSRSE